MSFESEAPKILAALRPSIAKVAGTPAEAITLETRPHSDLGMDSLDVVELVMTLEEELDVQISDDDAVMMFDSPGTRWSVYEAFRTSKVLRLIGAYSLIRLIFREETKRQELADRYGVGPFSVGMACVMLYRLGAVRTS